MLDQYLLWARRAMLSRFQRDASEKRNITQAIQENSRACLRAVRGGNAWEAPAIIRSDGDPDDA